MSQPVPVPVLSALVGVLLVATRSISLHGTGAVLQRSAPVLGFLVAITVVAELADSAGVFDLAAAGAARLGGGSTRRLFLLVAVLCAVTTVVLSLDTTAVLLTPVVLAMCQQLELSPLPFAFAAVWLANIASLLLPVSNLTNLLALHELALTTTGFAARTWLAQLAMTAVAVGVLLARHRRVLRGSYTVPPVPAASDRVLLVLAGLVCTATGPLLLLGVAPWEVATGGAVVLLVAFGMRRRHSLRVGLLPWRLVLTSVGLFLVVEALLEHGLGHLLAQVAGQGDGVLAALRLAGLSAAAANLANNLPAYLALEPVARGSHRLFTVLVGVNAGPLLLLWGSLATLLWRERCAARGLHVSAWQFAREGLLVAPLAVATGCLLVG